MRNRPNLLSRLAALAFILMVTRGAHACLVEPATDEQLLAASDVAVLGEVVRKELSHGWLSRAWNRHGLPFLGARPLRADEAVAFIRVTEAFKGAKVGTEVAVQAMVDEWRSTCEWQNLRTGQNVLLFMKGTGKGPLLNYRGVVPFDANDGAKLKSLRSLVRASGA
jgi:hypothetical protein